MGESEKITFVKASVGNDPKATTELVSVLLKMAENVILEREYPFGDGTDTMSPKYSIHQCRLAVRYFSRMGAEGEIIHNENGINRTYNDASDDDILCEIMQKVKV